MSRIQLAKQVKFCNNKWTNFLILTLGYIITQHYKERTGLLKRNPFGLLIIDS